MGCRSTTVTKTLVIPVIDSLSVTEYKSEDGKLIKINNKPGFYNIIPSEAILSKKTTMFGDTIQVTGRSCEVSNEVETQVEKTGDFLSDILRFRFNGSIKLTETCRTSNGEITKIQRARRKTLHRRTKGSCSQKKRVNHYFFSHTNPVQRARKNQSQIKYSKN